MNKRFRSFFIKLFSSFQALFLVFQPFAALPVLMTNPAVAQAEASVSVADVNLAFNASSHSFDLFVNTDQELFYTLSYVDKSQDPEVTQAAEGKLAEVEPGVFGAEVYVGTCSGEDCIPANFSRGNLSIGSSFNQSFQLVDGKVVFGDAEVNPELVEQECVNIDEVGLTAGETLWEVDSQNGVAETTMDVRSGVVYEFPLDNKVSVTFSCLPKELSQRSGLRIERVLVSDLNLPNSVVTDAEYAYDITTDMADGTFKYDVTLPKAENSEAEVVYIEKPLTESKDKINEDDINLVKDKVGEINIEQKVQDDQVTVSGLDHFTTFIVIGGVAKPITQITTCDELQAVKDNLSGVYSVMNDIDCSATSSWNGGKGFVPIGNSTSKFTGSLDGNNYSITNLYINRSPVDMFDNSADWQGLFGYVGTGAELANIKLFNVNITGRYEVGGLVGQIDNATIRNCQTSGVVNATVYSDMEGWSGGYVGGLVGQSDYSSISKSSSTATVSSSSGTSGGLVGYMYAGTISNSYARGNVTGTNNSGGLAGFDNGSTRYSYSTGTVACSQEYCKGFIGKDWGSYSNDAPNFWDRETSGKTNANGVGRISKTTAEMKAESTFTDAGWDFDNIWAIDPAINDGYPYYAGTAESIIGPVITTESATNPTEDSVTITWTTDHPATSRVIYDTVSHSSLGTASNYGYAYSTTEDSTLVTNHNVTVFGLSSVTEYYFRAVSHGSPESVSEEITSTTTQTVLLKINEIDYDQQSTDHAEFIELKNTGEASANLDGFELRLINGGVVPPLNYHTIDLPDVDLGAGDYYVVCGDSANVPNCDLEVSPSTDLIQNGGPDAVALFFGSEPAAILIDTVSYEGDTPGYTEGTNAGTDDSSNQSLGLSRFPDGQDTNDNSGDFVVSCISPGLANTNDTDCERVTICHSTNAHVNPYNSINPSKSADVQGHDDHNGGVYPEDPWGDIIPPFYYFCDSGICTYPGKNWTIEGQAIWNNDCNVPEPSPSPTPTPTPTPSLSCGDGIVNNNESCDYGIADNGQGSCSTECTWVNECRPEMVTDGSFEIPVVTTSAKWDIFESAQVPGWTASWYNIPETWGGHDRPEPKIELHRGVLGLASEGQQYVELDTDWGGPNDNYSGEPASISLSQGIPTIPGNKYTVTWSYSPRPNYVGNHLQVTVGGIEVFDSGVMAGGATTQWKTETYSFIATADLTTISFVELGIPDSLGMFLDDVSVSCDGSQLVSVYAHKVVCQSESDLPNWGDDAGGQVTATTAQDYVDQSNGRCRLASDWDFEWGYDGSAPKQSGEYIGYAGAPWTEFNVKTFEASPAAAIIPNPDNKTLWFREVLQKGFIPFTYPPDASPGSNVSAEFYCNDDHYKYDNYESISNAQPGGSYYCVAFNAELPVSGKILVNKFEDLNANGKKTSDEPGLQGWSFKLYDSNEQLVAGPQTTGPNGWTTFKDVIPGDYSVCEVPQSDWSSSDLEQANATQNGAGEICRTVSVDSGETVNNFRFANYQLGKILVNKYEDRNHDGKINFGADPEPGLQGWAFVLLDDQGNQVAGPQITGPNGWTTFKNLKPGAYSVCETLQDNWGSSDLDYATGYKNNDLICRDVTVSSGEEVRNFRFGNYPLVNDVTVCKQDQNGQPQAGWTVGLSQPTGFDEQIPVTIGTGIDVSLADGDYVVYSSGYYKYRGDSEGADAGYSYRYQSIPPYLDGWINGDLLSIPGALELKVAGQNINWGGYNPSHLYSTLVTGFSGGNLNLSIFDDNYGDNVNTGDFRAQIGAVIDSDQTDESGCITFDDVPFGDYQVFEVPKEGWYYQSTTVASDVVTYYPATFTVGDKVPEITITNQHLGNIYGQKYLDSNMSGDWTSGEVGLEGWTIKLYNENKQQLLGLDTTDVEGAYDFISLSPGNYQVCEVNQSGWANTDPGSSDAEVCKAVTLDQDGSSQSISFGNVQTYDIHGYKWDDQDRDGVRGDEKLLAGWEIFIDQNSNQQWDDGEPKTTTSSDEEHFGWYWFEGLTAGTYQICEVAQDGWAQTYPVDPVCHSVTLPDQNPMRLAVSKNAVTGPEYNFGNTQYGDINVYKYEDLNTNGIYDVGEPFLPEWNMVLGKNEMADLIQTTGLGGMTNFSVLGGTYSLSEELQKGWEQSAISCDSNIEGVMITSQGEAYGHHGNCEGWNGCGDAATCALWACEVNGYDSLVSYGQARPCTEFQSCNLFNRQGDVQMGWGNWCPVMGVTDIVCANNSVSPTPSPDAQQSDSSSLLDKILGVSVAFAQEILDVVRPNSRLVEVQPGQATTCYVGNYRPGNIEGIKYFDENQNGQYDEGESKMQYWGISLSGNDIEEQKVNTDENGAYSFTDLTKGTYTVCEEDRTNWGWQSIEPDGELCHEVVIDQSGETETANFGNFIESGFRIEKSSIDSPDNQQPGSEVEYTIKVTAVGGPVLGAQVFDLPPEQFEYVPDSYTAESTERGDLKGGTTTEPTYASPGVWQLGNLVKDEVVTLTYKTKIDNSTDPGVYPDMAWATGTSAQEDAVGGTDADLTAISEEGTEGHYGEEHFAGTQIAVVVDQTPAKNYDIDRTEEKEGEVLGASTQLPATGANAWINILALLSTLVGALILLFGKRLHKSGNKSFGKTLLLLLMVGASLYFAKPAQAFTSVRVEEPYNSITEYGQDATTNKRDMKVDFVVLNTDNLSVTAQCQQQKNDGAWTNITTNYVVKPGGNSGYCDAQNLDVNSNYDFRVVIAGDGTDINSSEVRVGLDNDGPDKPRNYNKSAKNNCEYEIKFKTADDGQTSRVEIYRSDNNTYFTADAGSRVDTIAIGPNQDYTFNNTKSDCGKDYYYAIRAFDDNNNASDLVGDEDITVVFTNSTTGETQQVALGAIPVGESFVAGGGTAGEIAGETETGEVGEDANGEVAGETGESGETNEVDVNADGKVLGIETDKLWSTLGRFGLPLLLGFGILTIIYFIFFSKRK